MPVAAGFCGLPARARRVFGANRVEHTLMMSRSVWQLRESKFVSLEGLQWPEVLQGLQPARKPVGGMSCLTKNSSRRRLK